MIIKHLLPAEPGTHFAIGAFDKSIGTTIPFKMGNKKGNARIVDVEVAEDGMTAELTLDIDANMGRLLNEWWESV